MYVVRSHITGVTVCWYDLLWASACVCCEVTHRKWYDLLVAPACVSLTATRVATRCGYLWFSGRQSFYRPGGAAASWRFCRRNLDALPSTSRVRRTMWLLGALSTSSSTSEGTCLWWWTEVTRTSARLGTSTRHRRVYAVRSHITGGTI